MRLRLQQHRPGAVLQFSIQFILLRDPHIDVGKKVYRHGKYKRTVENMALSTRQRLFKINISQG